MYHVKITDETGRTVSESDGSVAILAHYEDDGTGVRGITLCDGADNHAVFQTVLALDHLRDKVLSNDAGLKTLYALKDVLVDSSMEIDLSAIRQMVEDTDDEE